MRVDANERRALPHVFVEALEPATVPLRPADLRHLFRSRRARPGDLISLADGRGRSGVGRLLPERDGAVAVDEVSDEPRPSPMVSVAMAPPKGDRLAWAVQKLTEVGVDEVVVLRTERSIREWNEAREDRALERLRTIAREAAMQSHRSFLMDVTGIAPFGGAVAGRGDPTVLFDGSGFTRLSDALPAAVSSVRVLIGPEGGFTDRERATAVGVGGAVVSLGASILRTETAAVVGAALVLARYGRLG